MLVVGVPLLAGSIWRARQGSRRAVFAWLGTVGYLLYNSVALLFATPFNRLFPLYLATLGLGLAELIALLAGLDVQRCAGWLAPAPARGMAVYLAVIATGNALIWLKAVVAGLTQDGPPAFLDGTGLTTNPIYVQDLAFWLPLALLAAGWLWQGRPWGYLIAGGIAWMWLIEGVGVACDQWFGSRADPSSGVATLGGAWLFVAVAVIDAVALWAFFRRLAGEGSPVEAALATASHS